MSVPLLRIFCVFLIGICLFSCKANQKTVITSKATDSKEITEPTKATEEVEVQIPLSENEYHSDNNFFRTVQSGTSPVLATAKKIALINAKAELAGNIQTLVKTVTINYTNEKNVTNRQEFEDRFEEYSTQVTIQMLTNLATIGEKTLVNNDGKFTCWVAIEMSKDEVLKNLNSQVSKDNQLLIDYDKHQYENVFNQEMNKLNLKQ